MENINLSNVVVKKTANKGNAVYAVKEFSVGDTVVVGKPLAIVAQRTNYSFQIDWNTHVDLDEPAKLINHCCDPNLAVKKNEFGGYSFVAIKKIESGEEVTWDYDTTEYVSIAVSTCYCGANNCRGKTKGYKFLTNKLKKHYGELVGEYLKNPVTI